MTRKTLGLGSNTPDLLRWGTATDCAHRARAIRCPGALQGSHSARWTQHSTLQLPGCSPETDLYFSVSPSVSRLGLLFSYSLLLSFCRLLSQFLRRSTNQQFPHPPMPLNRVLLVKSVYWLLGCFRQWNAPRRLAFLFSETFLFRKKRTKKTQQPHPPKKAPTIAKPTAQNITVLTFTPHTPHAVFCGHSVIFQDSFNSLQHPFFFSFCAAERQRWQQQLAFQFF